MHEDLVFHTAGGVGGQADALSGVKGGDGLDEADGPDGDQILLVGGLGIVFFHDVGHQTKIAFYEDVTCLQVPSCGFFQIFLLLFGGQGFGESWPELRRRE